MVRMSTRIRPWPSALLVLCLLVLLQEGSSQLSPESSPSASPPSISAPNSTTSPLSPSSPPSTSSPPPPPSPPTDPSPPNSTSPPSPPLTATGPSSSSSPPPPPTSPSRHKKKSNVGVYVGLVAAMVVAVIVVAAPLLFAGICICRKKRAKPGRPPSNPPLIYHAQYDEEKAFSEPPSSFYETGEFKRSIGTRYPYSTIFTATNGFGEVLGRGAFGVVYKGKLSDGTDVAVKKLLDRDRGLQDFSAEVKTLGRINHANLVALRGFCFDQNQPYVMYEYVANGSLDKWIFQSKKEAAEYVMPWRTRVSVLKGTAKGLAYLHEDLQIGQAIIHLDVKTENILLTEYFVPKVADFGLAKLLGSKMSQTLAAGGTMGYMAPEVIYGAASPKMDVYSFGVVLLEVLSGRRVMMPSNSSDSMFLPAWAVRKTLEGNALDVIDPLLRAGEFDENEAVRLVMTALLCLQRDSDDRPDMSEVMRMIDGSIVPLDVPQSLQPFLEMAERLIKKNYELPTGGGRGSTSSTSNVFSGSSRSNGQ